MKERIFRPRVPVPEPERPRSHPWGAPVPAPNYDNLRYAYVQFPWLRTEQQFADLVVVENVMGYPATRHLLWTAKAALAATSNDALEALWNRAPLPHLYMRLLPGGRAAIERLIGHRAVCAWRGLPGSRTVTAPGRKTAVSPSASGSQPQSGPDGAPPSSVTGGVTHETTPAGDSATGDDMSHDGNHHRPGARTRVSELDAPTRSAVPGRRSLTESLASPPVATATPAPAVQKSSGEDVHPSVVRDVVTPEVPAAPRATLQQLFARHDARGAAHTHTAGAAASATSEHVAEAATTDRQPPEQHETPAVQLRSSEGAHDVADVQAAAARGTATPASPLPHGDAIQRSFGHHDISRIQAHTGPEAAASAAAMGAKAYATGNHLVLGDQTDLHTASHEAAHVVQQRAGVQLKGGVGAAGDAYERHADQVADAVAAGRSAEALLDLHASAGPAVHAVQRKESKEDAQLLDRQARLKDTDVEIPKLEGALLTTRQEAVKKGLLSKAAFDASYDLSRAMTQLQPAVAARADVDTVVQVEAAIAAQQLFMALQRETAGDKNFHVVPMIGPGAEGGITEQNPYTQEVRVTTPFLLWPRTTESAGWLQRLPGLIHLGKWSEAFAAYRRLMDGLDLWVADQLRRAGKGTADEALGNQHERNAQILTGLEQIADKHATRLPALFHPASKTVEKDQAAGAKPPDTLPLNVYFWKDKDGKVHLYDMTAPAQPREQAIDGPPTASAMNTFFEDVVRYPEGEVRYRLPDGTAGVAPTTGTLTWYEWVGYAGLAAAALGLALTGVGLVVESALLSATATVCFAGGTLAGGISATGHLADSVHLGTATTTTVVLDAAQIAGSFASFGALSIAAKAGGAAAALAGSRYFVPLVGGAAAADSVQLVALTDLTLAEMDRIQKSPGNEKDKQRAMAVLVTQLMVTTGLTALSVQGARNIRAAAKTSLELVDQNGVKVLRGVGETTVQPSAAASHEPPATTVKSPAATSHQPAAATVEPPAGTSHQGQVVHAHQPSAASRNAAGSRISGPVPGLYDSVDPSFTPPGWRIAERNPIRRHPDHPELVQITTDVIAPDGSTGWIQRSYDSKTKTIVMENAFLQNVPSWMDVGTPMVPGKGSPTVTYLTLRQMKLLATQFGELQAVKMSTIQNVEAVMQLEQMMRHNIPLEEAVAKTHSVRYATTSIEQSGHTIVRVRIDQAGAWRWKLKDMMDHFKMSTAQRQELFAKYGLTQNDEVLVNYDILIDLAPYSANP